MQLFRCGIAIEVHVLLSLREVPCYRIWIDPAKDCSQADLTERRACGSPYKVFWQGDLSILQEVTQGMTFSACHCSGSKEHLRVGMIFGTRFAFVESLL